MAIVIFVVILFMILLSSIEPSITSQVLLLYVGNVVKIPAKVDSRHLLIFFLTALDLSIISAPKPISAAFKNALHT